MGKKVVKSPGKLKAKFPLINRKKDGWFLPNATRTLSQIKPSFFGSGGVESGGFGQKSRPPPNARCCCDKFDGKRNYEGVAGSRNDADVDDVL